MRFKTNTTHTTLPQIEVRLSEEGYFSCNACGKANYDRSKDGFVPVDVPLYELRIQIGHQTTVTMLCDGCADEIAMRLSRDEHGNLRCHRAGG